MNVYFVDHSTISYKKELNKKYLQVVTFDDMGYTNLIRQIKLAIEEGFDILINNPLVLQELFDLHYDLDEIFLYDFKQMKFVKIQDTTDKRLRKTNNLTKLWLGGTFRNTQYNL